MTVKPYKTPTPTVLENDKNHLRFIKLHSDLEIVIGETKYHKSGLYSTDNDSENIYTLDSNKGLYALSSDGRSFVTGTPANYDDLRYKPKSQDLNEKLEHHSETHLKFFRDGKLIKKYHLHDLVMDPSQIIVVTDVSYFPWIDKVKTDYSHDVLYVETVDKNLYVFDLVTGEILSSSMFSLDNYAATIIKQDGSTLDLEQIHICKSIFALMAETQNINDLSIAGFLESENKDNVTSLVAVPFQEIESIDRLNKDDLIFNLSLKNGSSVKLRLESVYQLCSIDGNKNRVQLSISDIKSINSFKLHKSDGAGDQYPKPTKLQLDFYDKGKMVSPWKRRDRETYTIIDYHILQNAIKESNSLIVQNTLKIGADPNRKISRYVYGGTENSLLYTASLVGNLDIIKILVEYGADVNSTTIKGESPILISVKDNNYEVTQYLITRGADINHKSNDGKTPLYNAIYNMHPKAYRRYLSRQNKFKSGEKIDEETAKIITKSIIELLLKSGANINDIIGRKGESVLHIVVLIDNSELLQLFLSKGADTNIPNSLGKTPLHYAKSSETVELLLEAGANPNHQDKKGMTLLYVLASSSYSITMDVNDIDETVEILLKHGADLSLNSPRAHSAFENVIRNSKTSLAELFIEYGADVNMTLLSNGNRLIHLAARGPTEILNLLLEAGADPNLTDKFGATALQSLCTLALSDIPDSPRPGISQEGIDNRAKHRENLCANKKTLDNLDNDPESTVAFCNKAKERNPIYKRIDYYCE